MSAAKKARLQAIPDSVFSWRFTITCGGSDVARLEQSMFRERAEVTVAGLPFTFCRTSVLGGTFALESQGKVIAGARKQSVFSRTLQLDLGGRTFELRAASLFGRTMQLCEGARVMGQIRADHPFTRRATVELPEDVPLAMQVFTIWLALMLWRRRRRD